MDAESVEGAGEGWTGRVYGLFPTQGEGRIDGLPWYYRSRHAEWTFAIARKAEWSALVSAGHAGFYAYGESSEPEPVSEAWRHIILCIERFRLDGFQDPTSLGLHL